MLTVKKFPPNTLPFQSSSKLKANGTESWKRINTNLLDYCVHSPQEVKILVSLSGVILNGFNCNWKYPVNNKKLCESYCDIWREAYGFQPNPPMKKLFFVHDTNHPSFTGIYNFINLNVFKLNDQSSKLFLFQFFFWFLQWTIFHLIF